MPKKKETTSRPGKAKQVAPSSGTLGPRELVAGPVPAEVVELARTVEADGGVVLAPYREPFGGRWILFCALPIDQVAPTPFQRDLSVTHVARLARVIGQLGRFIDPIVVVRAPESGEPKERYWTPNGGHRLAAMRQAGARAVPALLIPEQDAAFRILSLNTEKAHNLREKSLEVTRMARELTRLGPEIPEFSYAAEFDEPAFLTLGLCYQARPRFGGGVYHPVLRRLDRFLDRPMKEAMAIRQDRAAQLLAVEDILARQVELLQARGLSSPYLRAFVVARANPLRFRKADRSEPPPYDETVEKLRAAIERFDPGRVKPEDLARTGGIPETE